MGMNRELIGAYPVQKKFESITQFWTRYLDAHQQRFIFQDVPYDLSSPEAIEIFLQHCRMEDQNWLLTCYQQERAIPSYQYKFTPDVLPETLKHYLWMNHIDLAHVVDQLNAPMIVDTSRGGTHHNLIRDVPKLGRVTKPTLPQTSSCGRLTWTQLPQLQMPYKKNYPSVN